MATHNPTQPLPAAGRLTWAPLAAAVVGTVAFAFLAFRLSFAALTALAAEHNVAPDVAWMFAFLVDGGAVVGTVGVVAARRAGRPVAAYWSTVVAFAGTSLAFNVAHSDGTGAGVAIAVVPPVAQLVATELLVRMMPAAGAATVADVAPAVADATAAARRAQEAADAARTAAGAAQTAAETAATAVTAARADTRDAIADAVEQTVEAAATATDAAARAEQAAATVTAATAPPLALVNLAAAVAAVDGPPVLDDVLDDALDDAAPTDTPAPARPVAAAVSPDAVAAYRRLRKSTGHRPTAEALGAALGVKRTRGGELRRLVEEFLGIHIATVINP
ncbi:DUF2637 domain-containing protein [Streptomyces kasugaensis]|uniref:DUF2637 domain-containing protein n=1 Tax=Streptomyces kasugaensis TaxID=1946 RepID=A0A4Q9HV06_STRKA|nr:DUF2637 domain-containing protein [Streptomyces kasugaensis]TBO59018.1 DUF2637 domain-containing protein [Streptomyces kasugaensis]